MFDGRFTKQLLKAAVLASLIGVSVAACGRGPTRDAYLASGDKYFKNMQYVEAIVEYRNAVAKDPRYGPARIKLAEAFWNAKDIGNASVEYLKAAELMPRDVEAQLKRLEMLLLAHRYADVRDESEKILDNDPRNVTAHLLHANAMAGFEEYDHAVAEIRQAILLDPANSAEYYISLGSIHLLANHIEEAEAAFRMGAAANPNSAPAQLVLAANDWAHGRTSEAEQLFKRTIQLDPGNAAANRALAALYLGSNREEEAEKHLLACVQASPTIPVRLMLADYYIKMKRIGEATQILDLVAKEREGFGEARGRIASIAYDSGSKEEGHKIVDKALERDPNSVPLLLAKANFLVAERKTQEALTRLKMAALAAPRSIPVHYAIGIIQAQDGNTEEAIKEFNEVLKLEPRSPSVQLALARLHLANGEVDEAISFADQAVKADPSSLDARASQVRALLNDRNVKRAEPESQQLLANFPNVAEAHVLAGQLYRLKGDPAGARRAFDRATSLAPESVEAAEGLVELDLEAGSKAKAQAMVEERVKRRPEDPREVFLAGKTHFMAGAPGKAEPLLRKVLDLAPGNADAYFLLGQVYWAQHQLDRAVTEFAALSEKASKRPLAYTMIGLLQEMQGKTLEAEKSYEKVVSLAPESVVAANNLAWLYVSNGGNLDIALELARSAVSHLPNEAFVNDTLGWVLYNKGLTSEAIAPLEVGVNRSPRNPMHKYHLGVAYARLGEAERARQLLSAALNISSDFDGALEARKALAALSRNAG